MPDESLMSWWDERWSRKWLEVANHELLQMTNGHWLQFEPPSCDEHYFFAFLYAVIMIPGIFGNLVVILLFFQSPGLRIPANVLNVNLAIADLIMNLEAPILIKNSLACGPKDFSVLGCKLYGLSGGLSGSVAILSITGMAIQRYISISRPFDGGQLINMKNCLLVVLFTWVYGFTFAFMPVVGFLNKYVPEGYLTACSFDYMSRNTGNKFFVLLIFTAAYVLPLCTIVLSYGAIVLKVRRTQQRFLSVISANSPRKLSSIHMSLRLGNNSLAAAAAADNPASMPRPKVQAKKEEVDSSLSGSSNSAAKENGTKSPTPSSHSCPAVLLPAEGTSANARSPTPGLAAMAEMGRPLSAASAQSTGSAYQRSMIESKARTEMKLIRCAATLIAVWTIAWTPYATIALMGVFCPDSGLITPLTSMLPALFCKAASVVDPYIYSCSHPKYRSEIRSLVRRFTGIFGRRRRTVPSLSISMSRRASAPAPQMMSDLPVIACPTPASDEDSDRDSCPS